MNFRASLILWILCLYQSFCMATETQSSRPPESKESMVAMAAELELLTKSQELPFSKIQEKANHLLVALKPVIQEAALKANVSDPDTQVRIKQRMLDTEIALPEKGIITLYANATTEEIVSLWKKQINNCARAVQGLIADDKNIVREWMMAWVEAKPGMDVFYRHEHARDYLREIKKLTVLLATPHEARRFKAGSNVFSDNFTKDVGNWRKYGAGEMTIQNGSLKIMGSGLSVFCTNKFDNVLISFNFTPVKSDGKGPGSLFAFPARSLTSHDFESSGGPMENYNYGIDTYHVSLYRGNTGCSNLRRTGRGLRMLSTVVPDPCAELGKKYHLEIFKFDETIQVFVDGKLIHHYFDGGSFGPVLTAGCFGIRLFSGGNMEAELEDFQVSELVKTNE